MRWHEAGARGRAAVVASAVALAWPVALATAGKPAGRPDGAPASQAVATSAAAEPNLEALGIPRYPGMTYVRGGLSDRADPATASSGDAAPRGLLEYATTDPFEKVVAFYAQHLGPSPAKVRPKDLPRTHPGREIPAGARGRRELFRVPSPAVPRPSRSDPRTASGDDLRRALLERALGEWNVLVSDYFLDPSDGAIRARTTIHVLAFH